MAANIARIGSAHQAVHVVAVGGMQRNADADADGDRAAVDGDRFLHRPHDPSGDERRVLGRADRWQDHRELVAAQPRDGVVGAGGSAQPLGNGLQHEVARLVAVAIVDGLEAIEVAEQHREARAGRLRGDERVAQPIDELCPVGEPGQRVGEGERGEPRLRALALGDVEHQAGDRGPVRGRRHGAEELDVAHRAVRQEAVEAEAGRARSCRWRSRPGARPPPAGPPRRRGR